MLVLDIEWLMGVCFAARDPSNDAPDWPPQPDRVFSALVASWGARGCDAGERAALEWLEKQEPPLLRYCDGASRTPVTSYVPPNDPGPTDIRVLPERRRRQPRQFPAIRLHAEDAQHLQLLWLDAQPSAYFAVLQRIANDTSYIGHSTSVVRCRFVQDVVASEGVASLRAPYEGRLAELERLYERHTGPSKDERARPRPSQRRGVAPEKPEWISPFGRDWIVLEHAGGERPDLRAIAPVAKVMRDALMSAYPDPLPEWLSGHGAGGAPSADAHLAIAPLANIGFNQHSDGRLHGLALILPRAKEDAWRDPAPTEWMQKQTFDQALAKLHKPQSGEDDGAIKLALGPHGVWKLRRAGSFEQKSLRSSRYCGEDRVWTSATPVALDRHLKEEDVLKRLGETQTMIAESCARMGLPSVEVRAHKHAALQGAPSAWPPGGAPRWQNWARPASLKARPLYHATLAFETPVRGPIILGAGRFFGLGLFLPKGEKE